MYLKMNGKYTSVGKKEDLNGTNGITLRTGKFYQITEDVSSEIADHIVAAGTGAFFETNDPKRSKEVELDRKKKLRAAYDQQVAEDLANMERARLKKAGLQSAETAAFTATGVRA